MNKKTIEAIKEHARKEFPRESCGLIVAVGRKEQYIPCENLADNADSFRLSAEDYANAEDLGTIVALVHSHPNASAEPSEADRMACEESGLVWHILALNESEFGEIRTIKPCGYVVPLVGREFLHGVHDCYTIISDFYERERDIALKRWDREDDWWNKGQNIYLERYEETGFRKLKEDETLQPGDVILMQIRSPVPNHAAIFLGDTKLTEAPNLHPIPDAMLHHMYGRLSERVVYGGHYRECTVCILRWVGLND